MANIVGLNPPVLNDTSYVEKIENSLNAIDDHDHSTGKGLPVAAGGFAAGSIDNDDINAAAAIARTKLASGTASHVVVNDGSGVMSSVASISIAQGGTNASSLATGVVKSDGTALSTEAQLDRTRGGTGISSTATFPSSGVVVTEAGTQTLTNKTISRANNTLSGYTARAVLIADSSGNAAAGVAPGSSGNVLTSDGTDWTSATPTSAPSSARESVNLSISASVAGNALTVALKDQAGSDPSGGSPVKIGFRNSTATSGTYNQRSITSALSIVISSGSTLGTTSGNQHYLYVYALDNSGTVELAISQSLFSDLSLQSTTAEGGAGAADSNAVLYSTTARSNVPVRLIARISTTQVTAGTWAAAPSEVSVVVSSIAIKNRVSLKYQNTAGTTINNTVPSLPFATRVFDTHGAFNGTTFTAPQEGLYRVSARWRATVNNSTSQSSDVRFTVTATPEGLSASTTIKGLVMGVGASNVVIVQGSEEYSMNAGDTISFSAASDVSTTLNTGAGANILNITQVG